MEQETSSCNMDSSSPAYNIDWICCPISREHAAQDREWFTSYTPFTSEVRTILGKRLSVSGIGTVCLPLKTRRPDIVLTKKQKKKKKKKKRESAEPPSSTSPIQPEASSSSATEIPDSHNLVLHGVLHVPGLSYNMLSMKKLDASQKYTFQWVKETAVIKDKSTGSPLAFTQLTPFMPKFSLTGQAEGVCSANADTITEVFDWSWREKQRWEETHDDSKGYNAAAERAAEKEEDEQFNMLLGHPSWDTFDDSD